MGGKVLWRWDTERDVKCVIGGRWMAVRGRGEGYINNGSTTWSTAFPYTYARIHTRTPAALHESFANRFEVSVDIKKMIRVDHHRKDVYHTLLVFCRQTKARFCLSLSPRVPTSISAPYKKSVAIKARWCYDDAVELPDCRLCLA